MFYTRTIGLLTLLLLLLVGFRAPAQWAAQNFPPSAQYADEVQFLDANLGYAAAGGGFLKTVDGGQTWLDMPMMGMPALHDMSFVSADTGYAVGSVGRIIRTVDGGQSWQSRNMFAGGSTIPTVHALSGRQALITRGNQIFMTQDGGLTWTTVYAPVFPPGGPGIVDNFKFLEFVTPRIGYAVGVYTASVVSRSQIVKTVDGGFSWQLLPSMSGNTALNGAYAVAFPTVNVGYLADARNNLHKTTDGGQTWNRIAQGNFGSFHDMCFTDAQTGYAAATGTGGSLRRTTNGGLTWTDQSIAQGDEFFALSFPTNSVGYAVGRGAGSVGRMVKYTGMPSGAAKAGRLLGVRLFPNPAHHTV